MRYEINKFYYSREYYILLYGHLPNYDFIKRLPVGAETAIGAKNYIAYWSDQIKTPINKTSPDELLYVVRTLWNEEAMLVLTGDKVGWMFPRYWMGLKELVYK